MFNTNQMSRHVSENASLVCEPSFQNSIALKRRSIDKMMMMMILLHLAPFLSLRYKSDSLSNIFLTLSLSN